jgi:hypothetical protein
MKKGTVLILTYTLVVVALVVSAKAARANANSPHGNDTQLMDCSDPNPGIAVIGS